MRATTALAVYVSLFLATTARGDFNWKDAHDQALQAFRSNQLEIAEPLFRKSAELARQSEEIGTSANDLGVLLHMLGREPEAKQWLARALAQWKQSGAVDLAARSAHSLATVQRTLGDYADSERTLREALASKPGSGRRIAELESLLGDLLREQGKLDEARAAATIALQTPELPWKSITDARIIIADVDREAGNLTQSVAGWTQVLEEARQRNDTMLTAVALRGLGETYLTAGDRASAEPSLRKALSIFEGAGYQHQVAATLTCLGELYLSNSKPAMAEEAMRRAIDLDEKAIGATHPQLAVMLQIRAEAAARQGAATRAAADLDRAWHIVKGRFGERSTVMGAFLTNRGVMEERSGNTAAAAANFEMAASILRNAGPEIRHINAVLMEHYATVLRSLHRKVEAKAALAEAKGFRQGY